LVAGLFEKTKEQGLLIGKGGLYGNVIRITPPLTIEKNEIDRAIRIMDQAFENVQATQAI
jgi:4-aminobutyrate aminotransferase-like enzyme